jgi:DNA-nicking Smr family endonuclease
MTRRRDLTPKEERMWGRVAKSVRAIPEEEKRHLVFKEETSVPEPGKKAEKSPAKKPYDRPRATATELEKLLGGYSDPLTPSKSLPNLTKKQTLSGLPADRSQEKRVRRGKLPLGATLDLHGHTQATGRKALLAFVTLQRSLGETSVIVVTGKGRAGGGILKTRLIEWISEPDIRPHVSGYSRANQKHGGEGAFYLFLKRVVA